MNEAKVRLHVGQGAHRGSLTVFPVWTDTPSVAPDYLTGIAARVDVEERAGSPTVDQLVVTNRSDRPVLLPAGELLEGGMQHRALTATTLLAPARPTVLRVVCVEEGRWGGDVQHRRQARRMPFGALPHVRGPEAQHDVWRQVRTYAAVAGPSSTESLVERLDRAVPRARGLLRGLRPLAGQRGLLVGIAGRPAWLELFESGRHLRSHWSGLLHAAALDALGRPETRTPAALARTFAEHVEATPLTHTEPAGLGRSLRGRGSIDVSALRWQSRTLHLSAVEPTLRGA